MIEPQEDCIFFHRGDPLRTVGVGLSSAAALQRGGENTQEQVKKVWVQRASDAQFKPGLRDFLGYRKFGVEETTLGLLGVKQLKAIKSNEGYRGTGMHRHYLAFQMVYVLNGWVEFEMADEKVRLETGDALILPPGITHAQIGYSNDVQMLEITAPAEFQTEAVQ
jgi:mannose-6-phosphate isomerase-like protein (cupin superfamily)